MYKVYLNAYENKGSINTMEIKGLSKNSISNAFKELECEGMIVTSLEANELLLKEIKQILKDIINNDYIWTAELTINNELKDNEIFLRSDN